MVVRSIPPAAAVALFPHRQVLLLLLFLKLQSSHHHRLHLRLINVIGYSLLFKTVLRSTQRSKTQSVRTFIEQPGGV
jgi:hypothetical protein